MTRVLRRFRRVLRHRRDTISLAGPPAAYA
jgi:hypothetical protein